MLLACAPVWAQTEAPAPVLLERHALGQPLAGRLGLLVDDQGDLPLAAVQSGEAAQRFHWPDGVIRNSHSRQVHWLTARLQVEQGGGDWLLALPTSAIKDLRFYGPFDAGGQAQADPVVTGRAYPYASRPLDSERHVFPLHLPAPGIYTIYLRVQPDTSHTLELTAWNSNDFLLWRQQKLLFDGICYGILFAMLVYNLMLWGVFRDQAYGFYVLTCGFALLTVASLNGHAAHYLFPAWPLWSDRTNVVSPALWIAASALFGRSFLGTRRHAPQLDKLILLLTGASLISLALGLSGRSAAAQTSVEALAFIGTTVMALIALRVWRRGFHPAKWYLAGQATLFGIVATIVLSNWGPFDTPFLHANGLQIGVTAEMVVFAMALSHRIRLMRRSQSELRARAAHLAEAAATDPLTGVVNRVGLVHSAQRVLAQAGPHALMLLDLDRFKPINDTHGHDAGDAVLVEVARRLEQQLREMDTVARLGGDEFAILLDSARDAEQLALLARRLCAAVVQPVAFEGHALQVSVSLGIARYPADGQTLSQLLRAADQAMYRAKQAQSGFAFHASPDDIGSPKMMPGLTHAG
jgi:diguanylate cyclase (GGDEF)-like protein